METRGCRLILVGNDRGCCSGITAYLAPAPGHVREPLSRRPVTIFIIHTCDRYASASIRDAGYLKGDRSARATFLRRMRNIYCNIPAKRPSHIEIRTTGEISVGVLRVLIMAEKLGCERCGGESPADARFCIDCGAPLAPASTGATTRLPGMRCPDCGVRWERRLALNGAL